MENENTATPETPTAIFDRNRPIGMTLETPEGSKRVDVRFPTDDEWIERGRRQKVITKNLGRGITETDVRDNQEIDVDLLEKIREPGIPVDPAEAAHFIQRLARVQVDDVSRDGEFYRVSLRVPGGITVHTLKVPSMKQVQQFKKNYSSTREQRNRTESTVNMAAVGTLYQALLHQVEGYPAGSGSGAASEVPIIHQVFAVWAVINEIEAGGSDGDENF